jgi:hypothetical protein
MVVVYTAGIKGSHEVLLVIVADIDHTCCAKWRHARRESAKFVSHEIVKSLWLGLHSSGIIREYSSLHSLETFEQRLRASTCIKKGCSGLFPYCACNKGILIPQTPFPHQHPSHSPHRMRPRSSQV